MSQLTGPTGYLAAAILLIGAITGNSVGAFPAGAAKTEPDRLAASGAIVMTNALIDGASRCAKRYHAALSGNVLPRARAALAMANSMRQARAEMPGHWLFWDGHGILARTARQERLLAELRSKVVNNHRCVRPILARGGRIRCLKWKPVPAGYKPPPQTAATNAPHKSDISPAERRLAAAISTHVGSKGAFLELEYGTAFYHMVQRTTDELMAYSGQPYRATICTGAISVLGFYQRQLEPLSRKAKRAGDIVRATHAAAMAAGLAALADREQAPNSNIPDFVSLTRTILKPVLTPPERASLVTGESPFEALIIAREILTDQRLEAMPVTRRGLLRKALRHIEIALYAAHNSKHIKQLDRSFKRIFEITRAAHKRHCTCPSSDKRK